MKIDLNGKPKIIQIEGHKSSKEGTLFAVEDNELGIPIKRVFYITDFTNNQSINNRGNHSHASSSQFIMNIKGDVQIKVINIKTLEEYNFSLDSPSSCMYLPPNHHIFMNNYSEDAVMMVLCDKSFEDDRVNDFYLPESLDGFREAADYLKRSVIDIIEQYNSLYTEYTGRMKFKNLSELEFNQLFAGRQPSSSELINFYSKTENYILELTEYHATIARQNMTSTVINRMRKYKIQNVLDYGCGIGEDSIQLNDKGITTTLCDIAGKTLDFVKWRMRKRKYNPTIKEIHPEHTDLVFDEKPFDAIMCFEVLMHVPDPIETLRFLISQLDAGGFLFLTHRFTGNYSLALRQNEYLESSIGDIINELGLSLVEKIQVWEGKYLFVYKK